MVAVGQDNLLEKCIIGIGKVFRDNLAQRRRDHAHIALQIKGDGGFHRILDLVAEIDRCDEIADMKIKRQTVHGGKLLGDAFQSLYFAPLFLCFDGQLLIEKKLASGFSCALAFGRGKQV
ncbi:Uncharacterised protein [Brucella melitensis]|nr:Uncharacterised protein [Brucella melitensis]